jgi:UDP-N-acetylglucosamine 2-epimerase (non-hydrolysing)
VTDNQTKSVIIIAGTRPEAIKMIPVFRELQKSATLRPIFLSTGQHREMLDQVFQAFAFTPDFDLHLMQPGQTLPDLTARALIAIHAFLEKQKPDALLVQGDTTTVLAASLAAAYAKVPIGHVEAGLRTYDLQSPFPEEMNRRLTSPLCRWSFAPTERSKQNLLREMIPPASVFVTGNTVIDALLWMRDHVRKQPESVESRLKRLGIPAGFCERFFSTANHPNKKPNKWILVTGHRRESFGAGFESICTALLRIAEQHPDLGILYPVHLNPNVREPVNRILRSNPRIALIEPAGYEDFIFLMDHATLILTDSGGVQEEAPSLGKPVLVMRETTERPEGIDAGTCSLVGTDPDKICVEANRLLSDQNEYDRRCSLSNPYGDGQSSKRIRSILEAELS